MTLSSDLLLMKINENRKEILLEGDSDRYRIPVATITSCEPQCFFHPLDKQHQNELWTVRLMTTVEEGVRELLLSMNLGGWLPRTNARRRALAQKTCDRINSLRTARPDAGEVRLM